MGCPCGQGRRFHHVGFPMWAGVCLRTVGDRTVPWGGAVRTVPCRGDVIRPYRTIRPPYRAVRSRLGIEATTTRTGAKGLNGLAHCVKRQSRRQGAKGACPAVSRCFLA